MKYDVFISYSRKDYVDEHDIPKRGNVISKLFKLFEEHCVNYWIDKDGIYSSEDFLSKICEAIDDTHIIVFVSSENSHRGKWTSRELHYSDKNGHPIIALELGNAPTKGAVSLLLGNYDNIDLQSLGEEKAFARLIASINKKLDELDPNRKKIRELKEEQGRLRREIKQKEAEWKAVNGKLAELGERVEDAGFVDAEQVKALQKTVAEKKRR